MRNYSKILKQAKNFEKKVHEVNPSVVVTEHEGVDPVSYMAFNNLKTVINDATELLSILNNEDDLPQWVDEMLAMSKGNVSKALDYVRSEKTETESLLEDEDHDHELIAEGQYRGFLSSVKDVFNRPKTDLEIKLVQIDEELRDAFLSYGPSELSLTKNLNLAQKSINENNFLKARKHLTDFNNALQFMSNRATDFINYSKLPGKQAGFFDFFKSKKEQPVRTEISQLLFEQFNKLILAGESTLIAVKSIFEMLDKYRSDKNINAYISMLESLKNEQRIFSEKFDTLKKEYFMYLGETGSEMIGSTLKEMKKDLYQPKEDKYVGVGGLETSQAPIKALKFEVPPPEAKKDQFTGYDVSAPESELSPWAKQMLPVSPKFDRVDETGECPCGSRLPWLACHGFDENKFEKMRDEITDKMAKDIMIKKNISYKEAKEEVKEEAERQAEIRYYNWVNLYLARKARIEAEKEAKKEENRQKRIKDYLKFESNVEHIFPQRA
jgi:hypothetical protein